MVCASVTEVPPLDPPRLVMQLARAVHDAGGRAFAVGGVVRDHILRRPVTDWDIEVHEVPEPTLEGILNELGTVDAVGRAFSVFKLTRRGLTIDVSLPRTDSNSGPGHRGIAVRGDPWLGVEAASRRRDLTLNAILMDVLTGELVDPHGGVADLRARRLRAVDDDTFLEDPLRALRVVQFAARLAATPSPGLVDLCVRADVHELPAERIRGEWFKLLLAAEPGRGLRIAEQTTLLQRIFPGTRAVAADALERAVDARDVEPVEGRQLALMLLIWLADASSDVVEHTLDRLQLFRWGGYKLRDAVCAAHAGLDHPVTTDAHLRALATRSEPFLVCTARWALDTDASMLDALERATELGVRHEPEAPFVQGRDLIALGVRPGPHMGQLLASLYDRQVAGELRSRDSALAAAASWAASDPTASPVPEKGPES